MGLRKDDKKRNTLAALEFRQSRDSVEGYENMPVVHRLGQVDFDDLKMTERTGVVSEHHQGSKKPLSPHGLQPQNVHSRMSVSEKGKRT